MRSLEEQLSQYASYHLDRRNVATHFVGIPLIVLAVAALLARVPLTGFFSLMHLVALVAGLYYLLLDGRIGLLMVLFLAVSPVCLLVSGAIRTSTLRRLPRPPSGPAVPPPRPR